MIHGRAISLKQLRSLTAIVEAGNLAAAAEVLGVTGPAVSTQLKLLEQNFGVRLLERGPDGRPRPTPAGHEVIDATARIESALTRCFRRVEAVEAGHAGQVSLCVVSTAKYYAPGLVVRIRDAHPDIRVSLTVGNRGEVIEALKREAVDLAIMGRPPRVPAVEADLLGEHPHVMIAPPGHPLAQGQDVAAEEIAGETFLNREPGSGTRILMERYLDRIGDGRMRETVELDSNETIKQAVMAGLGIALISLHTVTAEIEAGRLATINLPGLPIRREWFLVRPAGMPLSPAAERLRAFILGLRGAYLPGA